MKYILSWNFEEKRRKNTILLQWKPIFSWKIRDFLMFFPALFKLVYFYIEKTPDLDYLDHVGFNEPSDDFCTLFVKKLWTHKVTRVHKKHVPDTTFFTIYIIYNFPQKNWTRSMGKYIKHILEPTDEELKKNMFLENSVLRKKIYNILNTLFS